MIPGLFGASDMLDEALHQLGYIHISESTILVYLIF